MKILIIKPSSFGDIIQANPVLTALRASYPDAQIKWLLFDNWKETASLFPRIDGVILWNRKSGGLKEYGRVLGSIRKEKFDVVIDLQGLFRTALLAAFSGAKTVIGVPGLKELSYLIIKEAFPASRSLNAVNRSLETVRYLTGKSFKPVFSLQVPKDAIADADRLLTEYIVSPKDRLIGIIPSARGPAKQWPKHYYDKLIELILAASENKVVILGEKNAFESKARERVINLCGKTSLLTLAAVLSRCSNVVGGDTGPVHLAAALGRHVTVIFGGSDVNETAPVTPKTVILKKDFPCSPCRTRPDCKDRPCLTKITPEEVFAEL